MKKKINYQYKNRSSKSKLFNSRMITEYISIEHQHLLKSYNVAASERFGILIGGLSQKKL